MPFGKGRLATHNRILDAFIGGWSTSGIVNSQSGMDFTPILGSGGYFVSTGGGAITPTGLTLRPDIVPGQQWMNLNWDSNNPFAVPFMNVNYFAAPGSLNNPRLGSLPRSLPGCRSPRMVSLNGCNCSSMRSTPPVIRYSSLIRISATAYNGFNTASITNPAVPAFALQFFVRNGLITTEAELDMPMNQEFAGDRARFSTRDW